MTDQEKIQRLRRAVRDLLDAADMDERKWLVGSQAWLRAHAALRETEDGQ